MPVTIVTFEDLLQALVNNFDTHQQQHWLDGDLINRYFRGPKTAKDIPTGKIAEHLQCSRQYVWFLCRTAAFWPEECREAFADHAWTWFKETMRMPEAGKIDTMELAEKYAGYSIRELKDARITGKSREDRETIRVTLLRESLELLDEGADVVTTARLKDGSQLKVVIGKVKE